MKNDRVQSTSTEDLELLKFIFKYYNGSFFHMARDEYYDEYKKYNVPKKVEEQWVKELQNEHIEEFVNGFEWKYFGSLMDTIHGHKTFDVLFHIHDLLVVNKVKINSYSKYMILRQLRNSLESFKNYGYDKNIPFNELKEIALTLSKEIIISDVLQEMHKIPYLLN
jgi:hypothetical protein